MVPDLTMSLNNLGAMLSSLGRREEALDATREAIVIRGTQARARPDAFPLTSPRPLVRTGARFMPGVAVVRVGQVREPLHRVVSEVGVRADKPAR